MTDRSPKDDDPGGPQPVALARREDEVRLPDAYEREYMRSDGALLARDKRAAGGWLHAIFGVSAASIAALSLASGAWGSLATLPLLGALWLLFSVLRVSVSEASVNIQFGLFGPKIPIAAIESAEARNYNAMKFGGWGIKRSFDGEWIYNMPGDGGRGLRIVWRDAKGRERVTWVGSPRADALEAAIHQARAALPAAPEAPALGEGEPRT